MPYEIDFLRAGDSNGDAIVVRWGDTKTSDYYINVIDGGFTDTATKSSSISDATSNPTPT
jgi:hypothetical protein